MKQNAENVMVAIPVTELPKYIGKQIHLAWANKGCTWRLLQIEGDHIHLETPKTKKALIARTTDAMYIRKHEPRN